MLDIIEKYWAFIVAFITAVLFLNQKGKKVLSILYKVLIRIYTALAYPFKLPIILSSIDDSIKEIRKELLYNGGNSLKDVVAKTLELATLLKLRHRHDASVSEKAMFECEPEDGKCSWVNESLSDLYGMSVEDMLDYGWLKAIKESEREEVYEHWISSVKKNIPYSWTYTVVNQKTGREIKCRATATAVKLSNGKTIQYIGSVTHIKRIQEKAE